MQQGFISIDRDNTKRYSNIQHSVTSTAWLYSDTEVPGSNTLPGIKHTEWLPQIWCIPEHCQLFTKEKSWPEGRKWECYWCFQLRQNAIQGFQQLYLGSQSISLPFLLSFSTPPPCPPPIFFFFFWGGHYTAAANNLKKKKKRKVFSLKIWKKRNITKTEMGKSFKSKLSHQLHNSIWILMS